MQSSVYPRVPVLKPKTDLARLRGRAGAQANPVQVDACGEYPKAS